jgi:hypothetical protein
MWYNEVKDYNFFKPGFAGNTGHFTQLVWKASSKVGHGLGAFKKDGFVHLYGVANYSPPGNYMSKFPDNVLKA